VSSVPERIPEPTPLSAHLVSRLAAMKRHRAPADLQDLLVRVETGLGSTVRSLRAGLEADLQSVHLVRNRHREGDPVQERRVLAASPG